jgi:hypothetical protein
MQRVRSSAMSGSCCSAGARRLGNELQAIGSRRHLFQRADAAAELLSVGCRGCSWLKAEARRLRDFRSHHIPESRAAPVLVRLGGITGCWGSISAYPPAPHCRSQALFRFWSQSCHVATRPACPLESSVEGDRPLEGCDRLFQNDNWHSG